MYRSFADVPEVASFTDAWIETEKDLPLNLIKGVASFTDAWIETFCAAMARFWRLSHLLQMRGLKLMVVSLYFAMRRSHLLQMRGLKQCQHVSCAYIIKSHLLQMRGLKRPFEHEYKQNQ